MRFLFSHSGRQFFFVTFTVAGRRAVLSRLVEGEERPRLTWLGLLVLAGLRALHQVKAAVGVSDFVIMPDHVHFLLIVDYDRDAQISPVYLTQRLMEAVEAAAKAPPPDLAAEGEPPARDTKAERELARTLVPMMTECLREAINQCDLDYFHGVQAQRTGGSAPRPPQVGSALALFDRFIWVELSYCAYQLKAIRNYIKLNPSRYFWKLRHPDKFAVHQGLKSTAIKRVMALLPYGGTLRFDGAGELTLLASPFLFHVRLTLKKTVAEHEAAIAKIVERARLGAVPVSGFISPGEKEALRRLKAEPRARFIKLLPHALPPRYDPSAEDSRELAAGRLAILSAFPGTAAIPALDMRRCEAAAHSFRADCLRMNEVGAALCDFQSEGPGAEPLVRSA